GRGGFGGDNAGGGRGGFARGNDGGDRNARMLERFKTMSADEQKQFIARMKERGQDVSAFEAAAGKVPAGAAKAGDRAKAARPAARATRCFRKATVDRAATAAVAVSKRDVDTIRHLGQAPRQDVRRR